MSNPVGELVRSFAPCLYVEEACLVHGFDPYRRGTFEFMGSIVSQINALAITVDVRYWLSFSPRNCLI